MSKLTAAQSRTLHTAAQALINAAQEDVTVLLGTYASPTSSMLSLLENNKDGLISLLQSVIDPIFIVPRKAAETRSKKPRITLDDTDQLERRLKMGEKQLTHMLENFSLHGGGDNFFDKGVIAARIKMAFDEWVADIKTQAEALASHPSNRQGRPR